MIVLKTMRCGPFWLRLLGAGLLAVVLVSSTITDAAEESPCDTRDEVAELFSRLHYAAEKEVLEIMFEDHLGIRPTTESNGWPVGVSRKDWAAITSLLREYPLAQWKPLVDLPPERLDALHDQGEEWSGEELYNMNGMFHLIVPGLKDIWKLAEALQRLPSIESARPVPKPAALPTVPNYESSHQLYLRSPADGNPIGSDTYRTWNYPGGDGEGVTVVDLEYSWNMHHLDIPQLANAQINPSNPTIPIGFDDHHGTAVAGILGAAENDWGITGIAKGAELKVCSTYYGLPVWNPAGAITIAADATDEGDVLLLEQQFDLFNNESYVPIEWWTDALPVQTENAVYRAIKNAVENRRYVVEAAGNGNYDLDQIQWLDSGAIVVGAGGVNLWAPYDSQDLERMSFSSYGSRVNVHHWGEDVVTTGYGDLFRDDGKNAYYTRKFAGTSSAAALTAGIVALCAAYWKRLDQSFAIMTPRVLRAVLVSTGTPQAGGRTGYIGPRPDAWEAFVRMRIMAGLETPTPIPSSTPTPQIRPSEIKLAGWMDTRLHANVPGSVSLFAVSDNLKLGSIELQMNSEPTGATLDHAGEGVYVFTANATIGTAGTFLVELGLTGLGPEWPYLIIR